MASDIESDSNPGRDARNQYLSSGMPRAEALNEQSVVTRWTPKPESKGDCDPLTNYENGKRYSNKPRPTENEHGNHARDKNCEPATRPNDEPRLSVETPGDGLLDGVH
jgi:hypothetical protein